jgi:exosome complex component RRP45
MPREADISINERDFIKQALQEQIRLDGRAFDAFRKIELTFGDEYGVADVQLGKTRYAACHAIASLSLQSLESLRAYQ